MPTPDTDSAPEDTKLEGETETVSAATTPLGKAIENMADAIMGLAASAGIGLTAEQLDAIAKATRDADDAGKAIANLQGGLGSVKPMRDPLDHDGDGRKGGSVAKAK